MAVRERLQKDRALQELSQSLLMLGIITLAGVSRGKVRFVGTA